MLIDLAVNEYLGEAASGSPAPGGGSVCSLVGALGAALASMVGEITISKEMAKEEKVKMQGMIRICRDLIKDLQAGVDADTEAFNRVMAAIKLPKTTDEEKSARSAALQAALKEASELPYETALLCLDVMNMALDMLKSGTKNAASDASVAGFLGYAALNGALYNVKINLNSIKDTQYVNEMREKVNGLIAESEDLLGRVKSISAEVIG